MLRVNTKPRKRNPPRIAEKSAPGFLKFIRGREQCVFGNLGPCEGPIEAMHLDWAGGKGVATKVADKYTVPACVRHHRRQHDKGWRTFLAELEVSKTLMLEAADRFWNAWPGRIAWERKLDSDNAA